MKAPTLLLAASLALNAVLLASFFFPGSPEPLPSSAPLVFGVSAAGGVAAAKAKAETWSGLEPGNPATLLADLRRAGFPRKIADAVATAEIRAQFDPRRKALDLKEPDRPFWEAEVQDPKMRAARQEITREEEQAIKNLIGSDFYRDDDYAATLQRRFPGLSADKLAQLENLCTQRNQQVAELYATLRGDSAEVDKQLGRAEAEFDKAERAQRAGILNPEELRDYDLRMSPAASVLRNGLSGFNPTEEEFQALYNLQAAFMDRLGPPSSATREDILQAQQGLGEQIQAALGDERYADYKRSMNESYQQTFRLVTRLNLPAETANEVWAIQQDVQPRMSRLQNNDELSTAETAQQLTALADETKARITAALGDRGFEAYRQYGGSWMQGFQRPGFHGVRVSPP